MKPKLLLFICVLGLVFSIFNIIDLAFFMAYPEAEVNPLVINMPMGYYYIYKMTTSFVLALICLYQLLRR